MILCLQNVTPYMDQLNNLSTELQYNYINVRSKPPRNNITLGKNSIVPCRFERFYSSCTTRMNNNI